MRVEFAKVQLMDSGAQVGEVAHIGDIGRQGGQLKFSDGTVEIETTQLGVRVSLGGLKDAGLFHGRHLRKSREIGLGKDGGGCTQIDQEWMLVVHANGTSGIYERLGRKAYERDRHESYWHL